MHRVLKVDGLDYVVVLDGLGLSSWCLPDEVVTDLDIHGSSDAVLSTDEAGRLVLAWDDGYDRSHLVRVDTLEREERYARFQLKPSFLEASGEGLLRVLEPRAPTKVARCDLRGEELAQRSLPFPSKLPVTLSTGLLAPHGSRPRCTDRVGRVAVLDAQGRALLVDLRDFKAPRVLASALVAVPPTWDVQLIPFEDALGVIAHDIAGGKATVWVVSGGEVLHKKKEFPALTLPTFATKDVVLTQVSDGELERVSLRDAAKQTLRLPGVGRETKLDPRGAGTPIAADGLAAFLPWHGESLITFEEGTGEPVEVSRLLPEDRRELRQFILQRVRVANEAARATGTRFELKSLDFTPKHKAYGVTLAAHGGDGGLWARTVLGALRGMYSELSGRTFGQWRLASMGHPSLPVDRFPATDVRDVADMLSRVDQYGFRFSSLAPVIEELYERPLPTWLGDPSSKPTLSDGAGLLLLQAFFAWFTSEAPVKLAPGVERWRKSPESAAALAARVPRISAVHARAEPRLLVPLAQLAAVHLKAEAGPLLMALALEAHPAHLNNAKSQVVDVVMWWARRYPEVARPLAERTRERPLRLALDPAGRVDF
jgi:hypothetical protein